MPAHPNAPQVIAALTDRFGARVATGEAVREQHGHGESWHPSALPDVVFFAESEADVVAAVTLCAEARLPIVPFGAGTSMEGQVQAVAGGLSIDTSRMTRIVAVRQDDMDCTIEPGVTRQQLNAFLRDQGLFFPVDPGGEATFGGMAATRASGTNAVRYGTMKDVVLSLRAVLPDGSLLRTGQRARKSSAGYDLTRLLIGSEGTLAVTTELTVKLFGIPERLLAAVCVFPTLEGAVQTAVEVLQCGVGMSRMELVDGVQVDALNRYLGTDFQVAPTLFLEFAGSSAGVEADVAIVRELAEANGAGDLRWAESDVDRRKLWHARHMAAYAALQLRPGCKGLATDVCVPISRLVECIRATREDLANYALPAPLVGHVGDGNFHLMLVFDPADPTEVRQAEEINHRLAQRAIEMEGTCSGEHGIGLGKAAFLQAELGDPAVAAMRAIKRALDPHNLMNPGKIFDVDMATAEPTASPVS